MFDAKTEGEIEMHSDSVIWCLNWVVELRHARLSIDAERLLVSTL